jgi:hypothetical protein
MRCLVVVLPLLVGCAKNQVTLKPYRIPCIGAAPQSCMVGTRENGESTLFYSGIQKFTFKWGETHRVTYVSEKVTKPKADASSIAYQAREDELVTKHRDDEEFTIQFFDQRHWFEPLSPGRTRFAGETFACEPSLCADLEARTGDFTVRFRFGAPADAVATALAVE